MDNVCRRHRLHYTLYTVRMYRKTLNDNCKKNILYFSQLFQHL